jgi:diguanylate cyclase (GGDEF)-like protein/PAS domain S-box-containing protein
MPEAMQQKASGAQVFRFHQSEALLRNVMENAAVGMVLIGVEGRVLYANRAFGQILGYDPAECVGLDLPNIVHPDYIDDSRARMNDLAAGRLDAYRAERRYFRKDGQEIWVLVAVSILRSDRTGKPLYYILQINDIDRQKRAEASLAESEGRWNSALEGAGQGVWDHDIRNNRVFYSRMWKVMRGFDPDQEVSGTQEDWLKRVHPEDRERILAEVRRQDSGEVSYNAFEYRERHQRGHWIWILSRGRPIDWFPDGSVARIVGTDTDITALKTVEAALGEEQERLKVTLESIGDGVISTDAEGRITFMNPVAEQMTGWESADSIGRLVDEVFTVIDEATGSTAINPVAACLAGKDVKQPGEDTVLLGRSGRRRDVRISAAPVRTPQGAVMGAVLVFQDVTQSRALQKELAHSATHDSLTALPNRAAFERALAKAVEQARRESREHALCFVDLDHFKAVNDSAGHAAGDSLLQKVAEAIRRGCRAQDFAARIGGDEFAILLADCSPTAAKQVAQKIVDAIAGIHFTWHGRTCQIGASVGITAITSRSPRAPALLAEADVACYAAKSAGRNRVAIYERPAEASRKPHNPAGRSDCSKRP